MGDGGEEEYTDWGLPFCLADTGHGCIYRSYIDEDGFLRWRLESGRERGMKLSSGNPAGIVAASSDRYIYIARRIIIRTVHGHAY